VDVQGLQDTSPVGRGGSFYFENLAPGPHAATVRYQGRTCSLVLEVPQDDAPVANLGVLRCAAQEER